MGFPGKPFIQGYPQISGCFGPLDLPSEKPGVTGVRDASPRKREQQCCTLINIDRNPPLQEPAIKCNEIGLKILDQKLSRLLPDITTQDPYHPHNALT